MYNITQETVRPLHETETFSVDSRTWQHIFCIVVRYTYLVVHYPVNL
ncbi:hypothetical protein ERYG_05744 [Escherichia coli M114]|nr:hypothetical protein ERYG_05744 [Escherichia coli M114]